MKSASENPNRLQEIYSVLKKREIVKGLTPEKLRLILEDFGPTFVKLGQIMSMRNDILPAKYCHELEKLRADVNPLPAEEIKSVIEEEYGQPVSEVFETFDDKPLGSASIAQVHAAVLKDGRKIVVKVQRPHIRDIMSKDFALLRKASAALRLIPVGETVDFNMVLDELWTVSQQEMDFLAEARHAEEFYELNKDVKFAACPVIESALTTSKVLVMEYIEGLAVDDIKKLEENGYDRNEIGTKLVDNYIKQVIDDGFFHADPHPGNIRIRDGKIVWIDMGMMGRLSHRDKGLIKCAIKAVVQNDVNELKSVVLQMGIYNTEINHIKLYSDIDGFLEKYSSVEMGELNMGSVLEELFSVASSHHISMPKGVSILGRGMLTLEGVVSRLSPDVNIVNIASVRIIDDMKRDFNVKKEVITGAQKMYSSGNKAMDIPALAADLMRSTIKGQTKVNLDLTGSREPLEKIDIMVTKLVVSILAASLLLGSSVICTTDMTPRTFSIPTLGFFGYVVALVLSIWLILTSKRKKRKKRK